MRAWVEDLVHGVGAGQRQRHQRMAHLVIGHGFPLLRIEHTVLPFQAGHDAPDGGGEVLQFHSLRLAPRRVQRCFVHEIGQISAGKAGGQRRHLFQVYTVGQGDLLDMDLQDIQATFLVGTVHQHLTVEATGAKQGLIEDLRPVGGCKDDQPDRAVEAIHFGEQLVQRLLTRVVSTDRSSDTACAAQSIQLIDEDDRRCLRTRLFEQIAHTGRTHADEHLDKL